MYGQREPAADPTDGRGRGRARTTKGRQEGLEKTDEKRAKIRGWEQSPRDNWRENRCNSCGFAESLRRMTRASKTPSDPRLQPMAYAGRDRAGATPIGGLWRRGRPEWWQGLEIGQNRPRRRRRWRWIEDWRWEVWPEMKTLSVDLEAMEIGGERERFVKEEWCVSCNWVKRGNEY